MSRGGCLDKRKHKRWQLSKQLPIMDKNTDKYIGHIANISLGGAAFVSDKAFKSDGYYNIKIDLEQESIPVKDTLELEAKNVWSAKDSTGNYMAGMQFENVDMDTKRKIENIILHIGYTNQPLHPSPNI